VPLVIKPFSFACRAERLAWAGSGPDGSVVRPSGEPERVGPDSDPGEEVDLGESHKVGWSDVPDVSFIDFPLGDETGFDEFPKPFRSARVVLVLQGGHRAMPVIFMNTSASHSGKDLRYSIAGFGMSFHASSFWASSASGIGVRFQSDPCFR